MSCLFCQIVHQGRHQPVHSTQYVLSVLSDCTPRMASTSTWYGVCLVCSVRLYTKDGINQYIVRSMSCLFCQIVHQGWHQPVHGTGYVLSVLSDCTPRTASTSTWYMVCLVCSVRLFTNDGINQYILRGMSCLFCQIVHQGRHQPVHSTWYALSVLSDCTPRTASTSMWYTVCLVCSVRLYTKDGINQYVVHGMSCLFRQIIHQGRHQPVCCMRYVLSVLSDFTPRTASTSMCYTVCFVCSVRLYTKDGINQYVVHGMSCLFRQIVHQGWHQPVQSTQYVLSVLSDCTPRMASTSMWYMVCLVCSVRLYTKDGINQYILRGMSCLFSQIVHQGRHQPVHSTWYALSVLSDCTPRMASTSTWYGVCLVCSVRLYTKVSINQYILRGISCLFCQIVHCISTGYVF